MTVAKRFQGLGWFAAGVVMALAFYLVSLGVAAERAKLTAREAEIAQARRDLRQLETEFQTRANLAQLERWNGEVLSLAAPRPEQFMHKVSDLAGLRPGQGAPVVQLANVIVPQGPPNLVPDEITDMPVPQPAVVRQVGAVIAAVAIAAPPAARPAVQPAVATVVVPPKRRPEPVRLASADVARPRPAAIEKALLGDHTLDDLMSGARAETASLR